MCYLCVEEVVHHIPKMGRVITVLKLAISRAESDPIR